MHIFFFSSLIIDLLSILPPSHPIANLFVVCFLLCLIIWIHCNHITLHVSWFDCLDWLLNKVLITWHYIYYTYFYFPIVYRLCSAEYFNLTKHQIDDKEMCCDSDFLLSISPKNPVFPITTTNPCTLSVSFVILDVVIWHYVHW